MKLWKSSMIFLALIMLVLLSISVCGVSDSSGDVYYFNGVDADVIWEFYGERAHIDVTDASYSISGSDITVSLTVSDSISNHQNIKYYIVLKTDATSHYTFTYTNEEGMATGAGYVDTDPDSTISSDGKTLSYTYSDDKVDTDGNIDTSLDYTLKVYAVEFLTYGVTYGEAWYDYAPDSEASYYTGGDDNNNTPCPTRTPGFEIISILAAIGITFIILKRKKK